MANDMNGRASRLYSPGSSALNAPQPEVLAETRFLSDTGRTKAVNITDGHPRFESVLALLQDPSLVVGYPEASQCTEWSPHDAGPEDATPEQTAAAEAMASLQRDATADMRAMLDNEWAKAQRCVPVVLTKEVRRQIIELYHVHGASYRKLQQNYGLNPQELDAILFPQAVPQPEPPKAKESFTISETHPHWKLIENIVYRTGAGKLAQGIGFDEALIALKAGYRVARAGWNGKNMWICLGEGQKILPEKFWNKHTKHFAIKQQTMGELVGDDPGTEVLPYLIMKTADDKILMGWLASQSDVLAEDWVILEDGQ